MLRFIFLLERLTRAEGYSGIIEPLRITSTLEYRGFLALAFPVAMDAISVSRHNRRESWPRNFIAVYTHIQMRIGIYM